MGENDSRPPAANDEPTPTITDRSRFVAALAYVPTLCFLPYFILPDDDFARGHGRQAFLILFAAMIVGLALRLVEWAMDPVPVLGVIVQMIGRLIFGVGLVLLSGLGALRALTAEPVTLRILTDISRRLPF